MVLEVVQEDMGEDSMYCTQHPFKNSTPGGICGSCLQEKLGKLVSSSFPVAIFPSTSSPSASFRSDFTTTTTTTITTTTTTTTTSSNKNTKQFDNSRTSKLPFSLAQRRKKKKDGKMGISDSANNMVFQRSKSTTTPRNHMHFGDEEKEHMHSKKGFWSFLYSSKHANASKKHDNNTYKDSAFLSSSSSSSNAALNINNAATLREKQKQREEFIVLEENDLSPDQASFDRKVSRSRSVGCGSRSFSGDFFERISTGFGDCTLRRVESQREGKGKNGQNSMMKERVRCGGLFGGFMMITSSSSSSSSSSYWVSSDHNMNGKTPSSVGHHLAHGRSKSWGWAFASPMKSFSTKHTSKTAQNNKNATPNLAAIPSLLAV
ncbi:hypothetical protein LIER_22586 [Lithospermum erythrorhizon]|uniref:Uncharacterized protein n=1 Tax=Lithospermum erythrorhizon TaxID=34254 RepID=A0AAV3QVZ9_LITER